MTTKSKVFYADLHANAKENLLQKLSRLVRTAGFEEIPFDKKFAAIKVHFGEPGNLAYLRPNYAKVIVDVVRGCGGRPFLTDCNTLYVGRRKNALDHLDTAYENGYNPFATGCHVLIADGLKGTNEAIVPVNGKHFREAKIGRAIADADVIISLNHFKMHECTGIGGAIKNLGMGCGSRAGKMAMHSSGKPYVNTKTCIHCGVCKRICAHDAITVNKNSAKIDENKCVGCGRCIGLCPVDAINPLYNEANEVLNQKIVEYAMAVIQNKPSFHISLVVDVSPYCDCHSENDIAIVPDIGMFASFDPVALDVACTDAVNSQPIVKGSLLDRINPEGDYFNALHPTTNWRHGVEYAQEFGLGNCNYELIKI